MVSGNSNGNVNSFQIISFISLLTVSYGFLGSPTTTIHSAWTVRTTFHLPALQTTSSSSAGLLQPSSGAALRRPASSWRLWLLPSNATTALGSTSSFTRRSPPLEQPSHKSTLFRPFPRQHQQQQRRRRRDVKVYCDLDGVLVDFEAGIRRLFPDYDVLTKKQQNSKQNRNQKPQRPAAFDIQALPRHTLWERVAADGAFFRNLPWTSDGQWLWQHVLVPLQADILTGVPSYPASRAEKFDWCQRELGVPVRHWDVTPGMEANDEEEEKINCHRRPKLPLQPWDEQPEQQHQQQQSTTAKDTVHNVITCWSDQKHYVSGPNAILIDDRESLRAAWEAQGGIFVHHVTLESTLEQLSWHGIWHNDDDDDGGDDNDDDANVLATTTSSSGPFSDPTKQPFSQ